MMVSKKIAFVANRSWDLYNFRIGVVRRLKSDGHEIFLIAPPDHHSWRFTEEGFTFIPLSLNIYSTNPLKEIRTMTGLYSIYKKIKPDLIFHYTIKPNIYGTLAAALLKIPSVAVVSGLGILANHTGFSVMASMHLYQLAAKYMQEIWFLNFSDLELFRQKIKVPAGKVRIIPGEGVDTARFTFSPGRESDGRVRFLYAGRLLWSKGFRELEQAALTIRQQHPEVVFQLLGFIEPLNPDGIPADQIDAWQQSGLFEYLGETEEVLPWLHQADCAVLPSYREGLSRFLLEAASAGIPAIATDVPGCREIIEHGKTGFLCKPKNSNDLIKVIEDFIHLSPEKRKQMGIDARKKVEQEFDEKIVYNEYLKTLEKYKISL
jgi:glycosyltransferase involved in cell wall biosynthesis